MSQLCCCRCICASDCVHIAARVGLRVYNKVCVTLKCDDVAKRPSSLLNRVWQVAQGCCTPARHMDWERHIWDRDKQKAWLVAAPQSNAPSSTAHATSHHPCCHGAQTVLAVDLGIASKRQRYHLISKRLFP